MTYVCVYFSVSLSLVLLRADGLVGENKEKTEAGKLASLSEAQRQLRPQRVPVLIDTYKCLRLNITSR